MPFYYAGYLLLLTLGVLTGAFRYYALTRGCRYFFTLLILTLLTETAAWYLGDTYHSNLIAYRLLVPVQYALIVLGYRSELIPLRRVALVSILFVVLLWGLDFIQSFDAVGTHYPTFVKTVCNLFIIGWTLLYLNALLRIDTPVSFVSFPLFWLSVGWLLFSTVNLTYFATVNYLGLQGRNFLHLFDTIRIVSNFVLYGLFVVAFLAKPQTLQRTT